MDLRQNIYVQFLINALMKAKLNVPQLELAKLAQLRKHERVAQEVTES